MCEIFYFIIFGENRDQRKEIREARSLALIFKLSSLISDP
jgi:hypothetical protein